MTDMLHDLTRQTGGDVIGTRLPSDPKARPEAASAVVERAVARWALQAFQAQVVAATMMMLDDQTDVEPLDMCLRISTTVLSIAIGSHLVPIALTPVPAGAHTSVA